MPKDHFWNKRNSKREDTLDATKVNGVTEEESPAGASPRSSQKGRKTTAGVPRKHLFGIDWSPILNRNGKKSNGDNKVSRSVSSSALAETKTVGFKRTSSNGGTDAATDYFLPVDLRQRHSSERTLKKEQSDTRLNGSDELKSPSPALHVQVVSDYTDPWGGGKEASLGKSHSSSSIQHLRCPHSIAKKKVSSTSDTSLSPPSLSPSDDYEEPWDKLPGLTQQLRKRGSEKSIGGTAPPKLPPKPPVMETMERRPLPSLPSDDDINDTPVISEPSTTVSDYSMPCDVRVTTVSPSSDRQLSNGRVSSSEISPSPPPPVPVRYVPAPIVNAVLPLDDQSWYHRKLSRSEAELILKDKPDFSFLVRDSESSSDPYSLSIRNLATGFMHLKIGYKNGGYVIGQFSKPYCTVPEAIEFYTRNKLTLKGADHKQLVHPVYVTRN